MDYARIDNGLVVELFSTELDITQLFHPDLVWAEIPEGTSRPSEGWVAKNNEGEWSFSEKLEPEPSEGELKRDAIYRRDFLIAAANEVTAGMGDAFLAGLLNPEDVDRFKAFAAYKLKLNKVVEQPGFPQVIDWPEVPL